MQQPHVHYWRLEPPTQPTSKGVCRDCGETREFRNRLTDEQEIEVAWTRPPRGFVYRIEYENVLWR